MRKKLNWTVIILAILIGASTPAINYYIEANNQFDQDTALYGEMYDTMISPAINTLYLSHQYFANSIHIQAATEFKQNQISFLYTKLNYNYSVSNESYPPFNQAATYYDSNVSLVQIGYSNDLQEIIKEESFVTPIPKIFGYWPSYQGIATDSEIFYTIQHLPIWHGQYDEIFHGTYQLIKFTQDTILENYTISLQDWPDLASNGIIYLQIENIFIKGTDLYISEFLAGGETESFGGFVDDRWPAIRRIVKINLDNMERTVVCTLNENDKVFFTDDGIILRRMTFTGLLSAPGYINNRNQTVIRTFYKFAWDQIEKLKPGNGIHSSIFEHWFGRYLPPISDFENSVTLEYMRDVFTYISDDYVVLLYNADLTGYSFYSQIHGDGHIVAIDLVPLETRDLNHYLDHAELRRRAFEGAGISLLVLGFIGSVAVIFIDVKGIIREV